MFKKLLIAALLLVPSTVEAKREPLKVQRYASLSDFQCMVANLYFESRGESVEGMKAVAKVTMNRYKSKRYPNTICDVIFQKKQFSWTHQLRWSHIHRIATGDVSRLRASDQRAYYNAVKVAYNAVNGRLDIPNLRGSMFYHAKSVKPAWAKKMQRVAVVGNHVFYKG